MNHDDPERLRAYLDHILRAIGRILRYSAGLDLAGFLANEMAQDAVIRNLEIIGEVARNVQRHFPETATAHPEVPWTAAYLMRNQVAHGYFDVDLGIVWRTIHDDLPPMEARITGLLATLLDGGGELPAPGTDQ